MGWNGEQEGKTRVHWGGGDGEHHVEMGRAMEHRGKTWGGGGRLINSENK